MASILIFLFLKDPKAKSFHSRDVEFMNTMGFMEGFYNIV